MVYTRKVDINALVNAPVNYEPIIAQWVWVLEDTRQRTKRCLNGVTDEIIDWIPPEGGSNISTLLYHIVAIEMSYLYEDILEIGWSNDLESLLIYSVRDDQGKLTVVQNESLEKHLNRLDAGRSLLLETLQKMTVDDFRRLRHLKEYDITPEWALHHLIQHEAEHRGQIITLRMRAEKALKQ